jgi:hypothetical protein
MIRRRQRHVIARASGVILSAVLGVGMVASPASADTTQATANAALVKLGGGELLTTGLRTSNFNGTTTTYTGTKTPTLNLLDAQDLLGLGLLPQQAEAYNDGSSGACAGVVGKGGLIQLGKKGSCDFVAGTDPTPGLSINLPGLLVVKADAILQDGYGDSSGYTEAHTSIVSGDISLLGGTKLLQNLPVIGGILGNGLLSSVLPKDPAPNTKILDLPGILTITANEQVPNFNGPGSLKSTALAVHVLDTTKLNDLLQNLLGSVTGALGGVTGGLGGGKLPGLSVGNQTLPLAGGGLLNVNLGTVTVGPNAQTPPTPIVPLAGIPIAALIVGFVAYRVWWIPRRRQQTAPVA